MGKISGTNNLTFKSAGSFFDLILERLQAFDSAGIVDTGLFYKRVVYVLKQLGIAAFEECETFLTIKNGRAKLPNNISVLYAAYLVKGSMNPVVKSINEQKPFVYYTDTEIHNQIGHKGNCCENCQGQNEAVTVVVRTYIEDTEQVCNYRDPILLSFSSNVRSQCDDRSPSLFCPNSHEVTIDNGYLLTQFADDAVVQLQYFGIPIDEEGLPMIPDDEDYQKAIEWYIIKEFFQDMYWRNLPGAANFLQDARAQFDYAMAQARYSAKLPAFSTMVNMIRRNRKRNKFWYSIFDKTIS